jgi:hypothetical protein
MSNEIQVIETTTGEVIETRSQETQSLEEFVNSVDLRVRKLEALKRLVFKSTRPSDWVLMSGIGGKQTVYLQAKGAESLAASLGIGWDKPDIEKTELNDGHYEYEFSGNFHLGGRSIWVVGTRASNSPFFVGRDNKPVEAISHGNVKKSAYTNWLNNGIKTILGIKNITPEDLADNGINLKGATGIDYKKSKETNTISEAQKKRLYAISKKNNWNDDAVKKLLSAYGFKSSLEVTRDKYEEIILTLEAGEDALND